MTDPVPGPSVLADIPLADMPEVIDLEPIHNCNLRCPSCHVPQEELTGVKLSLAAVANIGEMPGSVAKVGSTYEPTSHPEFPQIINMLDALGLRVALTTNGSLLTPRVIERIENFDVFKDITFSFDGATPEIYEKLRVGSKFGPTLDRIRAFIAALDRSKTRVWINYTMLRANLGDIERAIDLWEEVGVDGMNLLASADRPGNQFLQDQMYQTAPHLFTEAVDRAAEHFSRQGGRMSLASALFARPEVKARHGERLRRWNLYSGHPDPRYHIPPNEDAPSVKCESPLREARVMWTGEVKLCHNRFVTVGNLNHSSMREIWHGQIANTIRHFTRADDRLCVGCDYFHYCLSGKNDLNARAV